MLVSSDLVSVHDGMGNMTEGLEVYPAMHRVPLCEGGDLAAPVLMDSAQEVSGHADVKGTVSPARQNVDVVHSHCQGFLDSCLRRNDGVFFGCTMPVRFTLSLRGSSGFLPSQE